MTRKITAHLFATVNGVVEAPNIWQFDRFGNEEGELMGKASDAHGTVLPGHSTVLAGRASVERADRAKERAVELAERASAASSDAVRQHAAQARAQLTLARRRG